ncbi:MAG TPA: T9SS type A sorting domain-containing protein, partial [Chitinophagaceae bacterium]|nr:T9SS type A sorting domain-containing protein [Chitinophagaceae bacterium]
DVSGNQQWSARFNGSFNGIDLARSIALDGSGNIYVTGHCTVNDGSRNGGTNYATVKYDNTGAEQWVALYDNPDKPGSDGFAVAVDALDNVYVTGQSATKTSYFDFTTIKYSQSTASKIISKKSIPENSSVYNFQLRNYPNPFNQTTSIEYQLPIEGKVKLSIHDLFGREITTLVHEYKPAGTHLKKFAANNLSPGTYFYRIHSGEFVETRKLLILK